ncbi:unnamed protein product [Medioppia subpectinata]|uniref:Uncharacterized protein n=1 Tax=Medioppia subpectinata TaxID=1979941 RepID=A0A7R9PTH8_9ACAR|nr:unnamed protein product [Medioppia subpectinata]CAG2100654.1 unnamed protein product [Medioppia subpectinata]
MLDNKKLEQDSMFTVMAKFINATELYDWGNNKLTMIPENAFANPMSKLSSHAFRSLSGLTYLWIGTSETTHVMSNAFAIDKPNGKPFDDPELTLWFGHPYDYINRHSLGFWQKFVNNVNMSYVVCDNNTNTEQLFQRFRYENSHNNTFWVMITTYIASWGRILEIDGSQESVYYRSLVVPVLLEIAKAVNHSVHLYILDCPAIQDYSYEYMVNDGQLTAIDLEVQLDYDEYTNIHHLKCTQPLPLIYIMQNDITAQMVGRYTMNVDTIDDLIDDRLTVWTSWEKRLRLREPKYPSLIRDVDLSTLLDNSHRVMGSGRKITWLLLVYGNIEFVYSECPDPSVLVPYGCSGCQYNYIVCEGDIDMDLGEMFTKLSQTSKPNEKHYRYFVFTNTKYNEQLEPDTMFTVMSKFINATELYDWGNYKLTTIPADAFSKATYSNLHSINIQANEQTIGSHAFRSLSGLTHLQIGCIKTMHIMSNAFAIDKPSNVSLTLRLNAPLNETVFDDGALSGINRPTQLKLEQDGKPFDDPGHFQYCGDIANILKPYGCRAHENEYIVCEGDIDMDLGEMSIRINISLDWKH